MARHPDAMNKINKQELLDLLRFYPSEREVGDWFDVSYRTVDRYIRKHFKCNFVQQREKMFVRTRIAIKRAQIKKALEGSNIMLIWCGKQYLGQREQVEYHEADSPYKRPDSMSHDVPSDETPKAD